MKILVTAANGHTGFPAAKELLNLGFKVKAMVRNPKGDGATELKRLGAEIFIGDMNDVRDYRRALVDVKRAYFCSPFGRNTLFQTVAFITAAEEAQLEHVVYMSQWLSSEDHHSINTKEQWLSDQVVKMHQKVNYTFINTGLFGFTNFMTAESIAQLGIMPTTIRGAADSIKVGLNASPSDDDQGRVIAHILKDPTIHNKKTYRITGPKLLSPKEISDVFSKVLKRKVKIMEVSEKMLIKSLKAANATMYEISNVVLYMRELDKNTFSINGVTNVVKDITGNEPENFETMTRNVISKMPEAKKSFRNKMKAIRNFMVIFFTKLPNLKAYSIQQEFPQFINGMKYSQENDNWLRTHKTIETLKK